MEGSPTEWLFGIGVFSSEEVTLEQESTGYNVHSDLLATLIECGVLGLLGYLFLSIEIGAALFRAMRSFPKQYPVRILAAVGFASFVAFTVMGIPGALYTNVFVGWYYYGFLGFVLAQLKRAEMHVGQSLPESLDDAFHIPTVSARSILAV